MDHSSFFGFDKMESFVVVTIWLLAGDFGAVRLAVFRFGGVGAGCSVFCTVAVAFARSFSFCHAGTWEEALLGRSFFASGCLL